MDFLISCYFVHRPAAGVIDQFFFSNFVAFSSGMICSFPNFVFNCCSWLIPDLQSHLEWQHARVVTSSVFHFTVSYAPWDCAFAGLFDPRAILEDLL